MTARVSLASPQHTTENRAQPGANSAVHRFCGDACHLDRRPQGFHRWIIGTHCRINQRIAAFSQGLQAPAWRPARARSPSQIRRRRGSHRLDGSFSETRSRGPASRRSGDGLGSVAHRDQHNRVEPGPCFCGKIETNVTLTFNEVRSSQFMPRGRNTSRAMPRLLFRTSPSTACKNRSLTAYCGIRWDRCR
jgi:hypothetical protein